MLLSARTARRAVAGAIGTGALAGVMLFGALPSALADGAARMGAVVRHTDPPLARDVALVHRDGPASPAADRFVAIAYDLSKSG